jgi:integrase
MMPPYRSMGRGSFILDRVFPSLGRIRRASGTSQRRVYDALNAMLSSLWASGRLDYLRALRERMVHPLEVLDALRDQAPATLPRLEAVRLVKPLIDEWVRDLPAHRRPRIRQYVAGLFRAIPASTRLAELPEAMLAYRATKAATPTEHNRTKYTVQAFLRDTVGRRHEVYLAIADVPRLKERKAPGHPFTPAELATVTQAAGQPFAGMVWTMALTGMGPGEYWGPWRVEADRIEIQGTKTKGRVRWVPVLGALVAPGRSREHFRRVFRDAAPGHEPYDLRRSFARWLEEAGIPPSRIRAYMGHQPHAVTDLYQRHDVAPYLQPDAETIGRWLLEHGGGRLRVVGARE